MRRRSRFARLAPLLLPLLLTASRASAEPEPAARAQALFEQGLVEARAGNYASACPKLATSQRLDPKTSTLLNLASCYELNGQTASAWAAFKEAAALAQRHERADWAERATASAARLEPKVVRLTIHVPEAMRVPGLTVELDGSPLLAVEWDRATPLDPGPHRVAWSAPDHRPATRDVTIATTNSALTLTPLEGVPKPTPTPTSSTATAPPRFWTTTRVVGAGVGGVGIASLAVGAVFGLAALAKYDDAEALCGGAGGSPRVCDPATSPEALAARDSAGSRATASTIFFVAGGVLAAGGAALVIFGGPRQTQTALVPWGPGLAAVGRF